MIKLPQSVLFAIVALNITAFATMVQLGAVLDDVPWAKPVAWGVSLAAWLLTYLWRKKYFQIF